MCGIFGFIGEIRKEWANRCVDVMAHRGPDSRGLMQADGITMGHRRLSILDLSDLGNQPMEYGDGRYRIVYNGEIYNFLELRAELETKGHTFRSDSDTEVILASFSEWGEECQLKFNGMWAFAIWDVKERCLFLSRDRFGKKPLFYAFLADGFVFASEMKAIMPLLPEIRYNLSLIKADAKGLMGYESTNECLIKDIRRFPAGHCAVLKDAKLVMRRWWCTLDHLVEVPGSYEGQVEALRGLFLDACRLRMRSDVPIGTALSGGLDSSSVIAAIAHIGGTDRSLRVSHDWQHAFVAAFPGTPLDETSYARAMTDHLGIEAVFLDIDPLKVIDRIYDYLYLCEDVYITSPIPFMVTYGAMKNQGIKVTIDGHGADELFGGYSFDYVGALKDAGLNISRVRNVLNTMYDAYPQDSPQFRLPSRAVYFLQWHGSQIVKRMLESPNPGRDESHPRWSELDNLNRILYRSTHENVLPTLLRNYDRYSMANSVEIRMPFMDYRIVCFAFSIPWSSKIRNRYSKAIIRDAVAPFVPEEIVLRKSKIGFNSPIVDWMRGPLKNFFMDTVSSQSFRDCALIEPALVERKVREVIETANPSFNVAQDAWIMLMPYLWEQAMTRGRQSWSDEQG